MDLFASILKWRGIQPLAVGAAVVAVVAYIIYEDIQLTLFRVILLLGAFIVVIVALLVHKFGGSFPNHPPRPRDGKIRVAVFPLAPNPPVSQVEGFGDGIAQLVMRSLAQIANLQIIDERSMLQLPRTQQSLADVSRDLGGLDYVVTGTLERQGTEFVVTAQLRRVKDNNTLRTMESRVPWTSINDLPRSISLGILEELGTKSEADLQAARVAIMEVGTDAAKAFEAYAAGKYNLKYYNIYRKFEHFKVAEQYFKEAIIADNDFADAYVDLGFLYLVAWETEGSDSLLQDCEQYFRKALEHGPDESTALAELGYLDFLRGNTIQAVQLVKKAVNEKHPRAIPFSVLSLLYLYLGFWEESIHLTKTVNRLDPLYTYPYTNAALSYQLLGLHEESIRWADRAAKGPAGFTSVLLKGAAHFRANRPKKALEVWKEGRSNAEERERFLFDVVAAWVPASDGDLGVAGRLVQSEAFETLVHGAYAQYGISLLALAGETEWAIELIREERTYVGNYRYLTADQTLRPLYGVPQFQALLQQRYSTWLRNLQELRSDLKRAPGPVPAPENLR